MHIHAIYFQILLFMGLLLILCSVSSCLLQYHGDGVKDDDNCYWIERCASLAKLSDILVAEKESEVQCVIEQVQRFRAFH